MGWEMSHSPQLSGLRRRTEFFSVDNKGEPDDLDLNS